MSVFPFTSAAVLPSDTKEILPVFRELAYDFDRNCLKRRGGRPYLIEKDEALQIWIYKALRTRRFIWPAYSHAYGAQLEDAIGISNVKEIVESEVRRYITECLMVCPYIQELSAFTFFRTGDKLTVTFEVTTVYGRFTHESEIYNE